jgi:hypothetical protein
MDVGRTAAEYVSMEPARAEGGEGVSGFVTVTPISSSVPAPKREWPWTREESFKSSNDSPLNLVFNEGWREVDEGDIVIAALMLIEEDDDRTLRERVLLFSPGFSRPFCRP